MTQTTSSDDQTNRLVFILFHALNIVLVVASVFCAWVLKDEGEFDQVMAQIFIFSTLFTLLGSKAGGYLGAVMEENACSKMDMGVLSAMGSFVGATIFGLVGSALAGLYFFFPPLNISLVLGGGYFIVLCFCHQKKANVYRLNKIGCCGVRLDASNLPLPVQPMKMKNKLAMVLALSVVIEVCLTLLMFFVMRRDFANNTMLGGMAYAMSGGMLGGLIGGWLAGLLDMHNGEPEQDNPIMVCGMALMGGMMGAMPAAMVGGMNALMGMATIIPTIAGGILILLICYLWIYRPEFRLQWTTRDIAFPFLTGGIKWQRQS